MCHHIQTYLVWGTLISGMLLNQISHTVKLIHSGFIHMFLPFLDLGRTCRVYEMQRSVSGGLFEQLCSLNFS